MKVFICWSGELSKRVAAELRDWLPDVIQSVEPFFSEEDISSGKPWFQTIDEEIKNTYFGILCLTQENKHSRWIHYEAGGLRKGIGDSRVVPLLVGLNSTDVDQPLAAFQLISSDKSGIAKLVNSINDHEDSETGLTAVRLERAFEKNWDSLSSRLSAAKDQFANSTSQGVQRSSDDKLDELLSLSRQMVKGQRVPASSSKGGLSRSALRYVASANPSSHVISDFVYGDGSPVSKEELEKMTDKDIRARFIKASSSENTAGKKDVEE